MVRRPSKRSGPRPVDEATVYDLQLIGADRLEDLARAAERFGLDGQALEAAARAAIAAPDRLVIIVVGERRTRARNIYPRGDGWP